MFSILHFWNVQVFFSIFSRIFVTFSCLSFSFFVIYMFRDFGCHVFFFAFVV